MRPPAENLLLKAKVAYYICGAGPLMLSHNQYNQCTCCEERDIVVGSGEAGTGTARSIANTDSYTSICLINQFYI